MNTERERIEQLYKSLNLSARQFADQIHVQPGTISNMMSGRNEPSYTVIKKILLRYPTLNPEWLITGKGDIWRTVPGEEAGLFDSLPPTGVNIRVAMPNTKEEPQSPAAPPKQIKNIVVYYTDGTYEDFSKA